MENNYVNEGLVLQKHRVKLWLSQQDVAEITKIQFRSYQRFEYGVRSLALSQMKTGLAVCALLDIDPYEFVFGMKEEEYLDQMKKARKKSWKL